VGYTHLFQLTNVLHTTYLLKWFVYNSECIFMLFRLICCYNRDPFILFLPIPSVKGLYVQEIIFQYSVHTDMVQNTDKTDKKQF